MWATAPLCGETSTVAVEPTDRRGGGGGASFWVQSSLIPPGVLNGSYIYRTVKCMCAYTKTIEEVGSPPREAP